MEKVDPVLIIDAVKAVLAAIRRSGRLPVRLDEEDMYDLESAGTIAALLALDKYDAQRGSLRAYLDKPIARAILKESWRIANSGITGDHGSLQIFSTDDTQEGEDESEIVNEPEFVSPDIAAEIEAFDHIWHTKYLHD